MNKPRAKTFKAWMLANFSKSKIQDIANHGADAGWHKLAYAANCVVLFDAYAEEIWNYAVVEAEDAGYKNVAEFIATFNRSDMLDTIDTFKNLMVWYMAKETAREINEKNN